MAGEVTAGLRMLLGRLQCFKVKDWGEDSNSPSYFEREVGDLADAQVVSSATKDTWAVAKNPQPEVVDLPDVFDALLEDGHAVMEMEPVRHVVVVDIDHPAHLVDSSTPGHHHLYVEIPPCSQEAYFAWLDAGVEIGLLEPGYVAASKDRGHSDVRLPWVRKGEAGDFLERPTPTCTRCRREAADILEYRIGLAGDLGEDEETFAPTREEINDWCWTNEGTLDKSTGLFYCTQCYIVVGQPLGTAAPL